MRQIVVDHRPNQRIGTLDSDRRLLVQVRQCCPVIPAEEKFGFSSVHLQGRWGMNLAVGTGFEDERSSFQKLFQLRTGGRAPLKIYLNHTSLNNIISSATK